MAAYSHAERGEKNSRLLSPEHIEKAICDGSDLYDMWPEAYTFADLLHMLKGYQKLTTAVDLPQWAVLNHHHWPWLLPGDVNVRVIFCRVQVIGFLKVTLWVFFNISLNCCLFFAQAHF